MIKKKKKVRKVDRKMLTFFLVLFPTLIIAISQNIVIKCLMLIYQAIMLGQILEDYYKNRQQW